MANETLSTSIDEFSQILIAEARLVSANAQDLSTLVTRRDMTPGQISVRFPKFANQNATALTQGAEVANSVISTTGVVLTPDVNASWGTTVTDLASFTSGQQAADFGRLAADAINKKKNADIFALNDGFSNSIGSTGTDLTFALVRQGVKDLRKRGATGPIYLVMTHEVAYDLASDIEKNKTGILSEEAKERMFSGLINSDLTIAGAVPVVVTSGIDESGDVKCGLYSRDALGMAVAWDFRVEVQRNARKVGYDLIVSSAYAVGEIDDTMGIEIIADGEDA